MSTHVAHHFEDAEQQFEAARLGMWIFLATEILFFGGLFAAYTYYRVTYPDGFIEGSRHLDLTLGTINTAALLTSSLTMVLAVHHAQHGHRRATAGMLLATIVLGSMFLAIKAYEYHHKYVEGLIPGRYFAPHELFDPAVDLTHLQLFLSLYFTMTGLHAVHMIIGIGVLCVLVVLAWRGRFSAEYFTPVEITGLYWHFVDIVWVFLFPLLYLIR